MLQQINKKKTSKLCLSQTICETCFKERMYLKKKKHFQLPTRVRYIHSLYILFRQLSILIIVATYSSSMIKKNLKQLNKHNISCTKNKFFLILSFYLKEQKAVMYVLSYKNFKSRYFLHFILHLLKKQKIQYKSDLVMFSYRQKIQN